MCGHDNELSLGAQGLGCFFGGGVAREAGGEQAVTLAEGGETPKLGQGWLSGGGDEVRSRLRSEG